MGTRVIALSLAVWLTGCGFAMTKGPSDVRAGQRPVCTEEMTYPMMDVIPAGIGFFTVLTGLLFLKVDDNPDVGVPLMIGGGALTVGSYVSGGIGYFRVKRCHEAIERHDRENPPPSALFELQPAVAAGARN